MKRRRLAFLIFLTLFFAYVGTFVSWWLGSPTQVRIVEGKQVRSVEFHMTSFRWHTRALWYPAFWFMQNVRGYESGGSILAYEESVYIYEK
jgi:hypothetical protein